MDKFELASRTRLFAVSVITFCKTLPTNYESVIIKRQLIRSSTSVGANYRAVIRARSRAEFIAKLCIVLEEADESLYWLELLEDLRMSENTQFSKLKIEAIELVKIFASTRKTAKNN